MSTPNLEHWNKEQLWTLIEASCLLSGLEPVNPKEFDKDKASGGLPARIYGDLKNTIDLKGISFVKSRDNTIQNRRVKPEEVIKWARSRGYEIPEGILEPQESTVGLDMVERDTQTIYSDEVLSVLAEQVRNGEPIDWQYWSDRKKITPQQGAKLAHFIDPIKWPNNQFAQGTIPSELNVKIQRLSERLADRSDEWEFSELVKMLGESVPFGMKECMGFPISKNIGMLGEVEGIAHHRESAAVNFCVDPDEEIATLFDLVSIQALAKMFPDSKWGEYGRRANRNGLVSCRKARAKYDPYNAGLWWLNTKKPKDWDRARLNRVLGNNLPNRSIDKKHLLTGDWP